MPVQWTTQIPLAMQRHTGSVFDAASKSQNADRDAKVLLPEYGDPVWLQTETATPERARRVATQQDRG